MDVVTGKEALTLDVGCGYLSGFSHRRGMVSIDIKRPDDKLENFVQCDAHNLPFRETIFRLVFFCEVVEHVENPSRCVREIKRVLIDRGKIVVTTPQPYLFRKCLRIFLGKSLVDGNIEHIALWTENEMRNLLRNNGFRNVAFSYGTFQKEGPKEYTHRTFDKLVGFFLSAPLSYRSLVAVAS